MNNLVIKVIAGLGRKTIGKAALAALALAVSAAAVAQEKGRFEVHDLDGFKLHVYYTNDALGDASYIVEGNTCLVTMEQPLFKDNVAEFDAYLDKLGKHVVQRVADYHVGGTANNAYAMPQGMPAFVKGEVYGGMMRGFAKSFGDAIVPLPTGKTTEIAFGSTQTWAGVSFAFSRGAASDFPAAAILIGGKVRYTHWVPAKQHANPLQISSRKAVEAELADAKEALKSGAELFIGGHGGAAKADAMQFKHDYLTTMKQQLKACETPEAFAEAMRKAYPELPAAEGLDAVAKALYK